MAASQQVPLWETAVSAPETGKFMPAAAQQALQDSLNSSPDARSVVCAATGAADHPRQDQQLLADPSPLHPLGDLPSAPQQTDAVDPEGAATHRTELQQLHHMQHQEQQQVMGPGSAGAPADSRSTHCTLTATGHVAAAATAPGSENQDEEQYGEHNSAPQRQLQESLAAAARALQTPKTKSPPAQAAALDAAAADLQRSAEPAAMHDITEEQQQVDQPACAVPADALHEADTQQQSQQQQAGKLTAGTASLLAALLRNQQALAALKNQYRKTQHVSMGSPTTQQGTACEQQQQRMQQLQSHSSPRNSSSGCSTAALGSELQRGLRGLDRHSTAGANPEKQQQPPSLAAAMSAAAPDAAGSGKVPGIPSSSSGEFKPPTETPNAALAAAAAAMLRPTGADAAAAVSAAAAALSAAASGEQPMQPETLKQLTSYLESMFMPRNKQQQRQQQPPAAPSGKDSTPSGGAALSNPGAASPGVSKQPAEDSRQRSASPLPSTTAPAAAAAASIRPESPAGAAAGTPVSRSASPAGASRTSPVPRGVVQQLSAQHKRQLMLRMKAHMQKLGVDIKDHPMMAQMEKLEKEIDAPTAAGTAAAAASAPGAGPSSDCSRAAGDTTLALIGGADAVQEPGTAAAPAAALGGRQPAASVCPAVSAAGPADVSAGPYTVASQAGEAPSSATNPAAGGEQKQRQRHQSRKRALAALFQAEAIKVLEAAAAAAAAAPAPTLSGLLAPSAPGPAGPGPSMLTQHSARSAWPTGPYAAAAGTGPCLPGQPSQDQTAAPVQATAGMMQGSTPVHNMDRTPDPAAAPISGQVSLQPGNMAPCTQQQQMQSWAEQQQQQLQQEADGCVQQPPVKRRRSSTPADVPQHSMPQHSMQHQQGHMAGSTAVPQPPDSGTPADGQMAPPAAAAGSGGDGSSGGGGGSSGKPQIFAASSIAEAAKHFRWISKVNHPRWSKPETPLQRTFDRHVIMEGIQQSKQQQARGRGPQSSSTQHRAGMDPAAAAAAPVGILPSWGMHAGAAGVESAGGGGRAGARGTTADPALAYTAAVATAVQAIQCRIPQQQPMAGLQPVVPSSAAAALQQQQQQQQQQRVPKQRAASPKQQQGVEEADPSADPLWLLAAAADALPPLEEGTQHSTPATLHGSPSDGTAAAGRVPAVRHDLKQQAAGSPSTSTTSGQKQRMQAGTQQGPGRVAPAQAAATLKGLEAELTRMVQAMGVPVPQFPAAAAGGQVLAGNVSSAAGVSVLPSGIQQQGWQGSGLGLRSQPEVSVRATGPEPIVGLFPQANALSGGAGGGSGVDYCAALAAAAAAVFAELNSKRQRRE